MAHRRYRISNPDNLKDAAVDSGMALGAGLVVALGAGALAYGASKITYSATTTAADAADYRRYALSGALALVGAGMQFGGDKVSAIGKVMLASAVVIPGAPMVAQKIAELAAPSAPAGTAPSQGMYGYGNSAGMGGMGFSTGYNQGLPPAFNASAGMGVNSGVSSYYRA